jgi:hypothetical protein
MTPGRGHDGKGVCLRVAAPGLQGRLSGKISLTAVVGKKLFFVGGQYYIYFWKV